MPFTYILFSQTLGRFYIGSTELPPEERLKMAINSFKKVCIKRSLSFTNCPVHKITSNKSK
jgi:hypothetical protein